MIDIKNLKKSYKNKLIFNNYNLHIKEHEFVAIIGKSGQGKSTLLNIIGLLDSDYEGEYTLENNYINNLNEKKRAKLRNTILGFIFQNYNLLEELNVIDNIHLPYCYSAQKMDTNHKNYIDTIIKKLDIDSLRNQKVKYLSGGEKQRVAIARSLVLNPHIILADEPTGNLDTENTKIVMNFLFDLKTTGKTIVMVTHDLTNISQCDKIIDLSGGTLFND